MATRTRRPAASPARRRPAGAPVSPGRLERSATQESLTCCVCVEVLVAPVTLKCGHSVCRHCLVAHFESLDLRALLGSTGAVVCPAARCAVPLEVPETNISLQAAIASRYEALVAARTDLPTEQELAGRIAALRLAASGMVQLELTLQERVLLERERLHQNDAGMREMRAVSRVRAWAHANGRWFLKRWLCSAAVIQATGLLCWVFLCTGCSKFTALVFVGEPKTLIEILGQSTLFCMLSAMILCLCVADRAATDVATYVVTATFSRLRGWMHVVFAPRQVWHVDVIVVCFLCAVAFGWQHLELRTSDPDAFAQLTLHLPNTSTVQSAAGFARSLTLVAIDQQTILGHGSSFALLVNLGIRLHRFAYHNEQDFCYTLDMYFKRRSVQDFGREVPGGLFAVLVPSQCMALELAYAAERRLVSSARANDHWVTAGEHDHDSAEAAEAMLRLWESWWGLKIVPFFFLVYYPFLPSFDNLVWELCVGGALFGILFI